MKRILFAITLLSAVSLVHTAGFTLSSPEIKANGTIPKLRYLNQLGSAIADTPNGGKRRIVTG